MYNVGTSFQMCKHRFTQNNLWEYALHTNCSKCVHSTSPIYTPLTFTYLFVVKTPIFEIFSREHITLLYTALVILQNVDALWELHA